MSDRSVQDLLEDILDSIQQIEIYTSGINGEEFDEDRKTQDAVVRNLEIIGEAFGRLPESFREEHSEIPWASVRGLRNRIVHAYFGVDLQLIWEVIQDDLPALKLKLLQIGSDESTKG